MDSKGVYLNRRSFRITSVNLAFSMSEETFDMKMGGWVTDCYRCGGTHLSGAIHHWQRRVGTSYRTLFGCEQTRDYESARPETIAALLEILVAVDYG